MKRILTAGAVWFFLSLAALSESTPWRIAVTTGAENWRYNLSSIRSKLYPRVTAQMEWWHSPSYGISAETSGSISLFRMDVAGAPRSQSQDIWMRQVSGLLATHGRYFIRPSFAIGASVGYRFWNSASDVQQFESKFYTQVPSFQMHAFDIGTEFVWLPLKQDVEAKFGVSLMPLMRYVETPDMPGIYIWPMGMSGQFRLRCFFDDAWFASMDLKAMGVQGEFIGEGTRLNEHSEKQVGGALLMLTFNASLGLGLAF